MGQPDDLEVMTFAEAAAECGWSVDDLIARMVSDGMLIEHPAVHSEECASGGYRLCRCPHGGYVAAPHPDIREL